MLNEDTLLRALEDDDVKCVSVSWVDSANGCKVDLERIGRACRERGVYFVVDGIQGVGAGIAELSAAFSLALEMGARAGILAVSLFAPALSTTVADAVTRRDGATADALQSRLTPLAKTIVGEMGIAGVKAALECVGLRGGLPRSPLRPLGRADFERVRQLLRDAELPVAA